MCGIGLISTKEELGVQEIRMGKCSIKLSQSLVGWKLIFIFEMHDDFRVEIELDIQVCYLWFYD